MTYSTLLSSINTPAVTGSIGSMAIASLPWFENQCASGNVALPLLKLLNLIAISTSFYAATQPGRLDGYQDNSDASNIINLRRGGTLLAPKGWAFIIWAPIFLGEFIFALTSLVAVKKGTLMATMIQKVSGGFIFAQIFQTLWAATFRPKYIGKTKGITNVMSAAMLTGIAVSLNQAHVAVASFDNGLLSQTMYFLPISLHFGWTSAAALVNWNGILSVNSDNPRVLAIAAWTSVVVATSLGLLVTLKRSAPIFGGVICWALTACADGMTDRLKEHDNEIRKKRKAIFFKEKATNNDILNKKGLYGASFQRWLCTIGAVMSGAAAVWITIQPGASP